MVYVDSWHDPSPSHRSLNIDRMCEHKRQTPLLNMLNVTTVWASASRYATGALKCLWQESQNTAAGGAEKFCAKDPQEDLSKEAAGCYDAKDSPGCVKPNTNTKKVHPLRYTRDPVPLSLR